MANFLACVLKSVDTLLAKLGDLIKKTTLFIEWNCRYNYRLGSAPQSSQRSDQRFKNQLRFGSKGGFLCHWQFIKCKPSQKTYQNIERYYQHHHLPTNQIAWIWWCFDSINQWNLASPRHRQRLHVFVNYKRWWPIERRYPFWSSERSWHPGWNLVISIWSQKTLQQIWLLNGITVG